MTVGSVKNFYTSLHCFHGLGRVKSGNILAGVIFCYIRHSVRKRKHIAKIAYTSSECVMLNISALFNIISPETIFKNIPSPLFVFDIVSGVCFTENGNQIFIDNTCLKTFCSSRSIRSLRAYPRKTYSFNTLFAH